MFDILSHLHTSERRRMNVVEEIKAGSEPRGSFFALLLAAVLIASFGLISNSTAVIIGAMLVSPLMTPILGISLALVRADNHLLKTAASTEILGVLMAIVVSAIFGLMPINIGPTPEMISRTQPNLLDLLVAVFAGFAGAYAMIDERISPALPGVAIATAIVPPLANSGLCIGLGAYLGAWNSFLLFFANFLSILLVNALVFMAAGFARDYEWTSAWHFVRRFGLAVFGFLFMAVFLTNALIGIVRERYLSATIQQVLTSSLDEIIFASLDKEIHKQTDKGLAILATVDTPRVITPDQVEMIQDKLAARLSQPVNIVIRSTLSKDMSARGSTTQIRDRDMNGFFINPKISPEKKKLWEAEQALWEVLTTRPDYQLTDIQVGNLSRGATILATLTGSRPPTNEELRRAELAIQARTKDPNLSLIIRYLPSLLFDRNGQILYGWSHYPEGGLTAADQELISKVKQEVDNIFKNELTDIYPVNIYYYLSDDQWKILIETEGLGHIGETERLRIEKAVGKVLGKPATVFIRIKGETVLTPDGQSPLTDVLQANLDKYEQQLIRDWVKAQ